MIAGAADRSKGKLCYAWVLASEKGSPGWNCDANGRREEIAGAALPAGVAAATPQAGLVKKVIPAELVDQVGNDFLPKRPRVRRAFGTRLGLATSFLTLAKRGAGE